MVRNNLQQEISKLRREMLDVEGEIYELETCKHEWDFRTLDRCQDEYACLKCTVVLTIFCDR